MTPEISADLPTRPTLEGNAGRSVIVGVGQLLDHAALVLERAEIEVKPTVREVYSHAHPLFAAAAPVGDGGIQRCERV